jgi:hypothetical protein
MHNEVDLLLAHWSGTIIGFVPAVERVLGNAVLSAHGGDGLRALLGLLDDFDNLLGRMVCGLHGLLLVGGS